MKRLAVGLVLLALVLLSAWARAATALRHPSFDAALSVGMVQSDPALLFYLARQVAGAGGGVPEDWRADARIAHPERVDIPREFTVGVEWLVAWTDIALAHRYPLHVVALWVSAVLASIALLGVYWAARELCASRGWGIYAALLFTLLPANYRTIGFVLVNEDLSLALLALHVGCAARAARTGGGGWGALSGLLCALALATWHAAGMIAAAELAALFLWFLSGRGNAFAGRAGRAAIVAYSLVALAVPVLFAKAAFLAPCAQMALALALAAAAGRRSARSARGVALLALGLLFVAGMLAARALGSQADLAHVLALLVAKARHLGARPADPAELSFAVRMMWQGPFETTGMRELLYGFGFTLLAVPLLAGFAAYRAARASLTALEGVLLVFFLLAAVGAWGIQRLLVLPGMLLPILVARAAQSASRGRGALLASLLSLALVAIQLFSTIHFLGEHPLSWHSPARREALRAMVAAVEKHVPPGEAVVADFMVSPALLAHTLRPVALEPKWESRAARARVEEFWRAFYHGTPLGLRRLVVERFQARYLLVDRFTLGTLHASRYLAGLARGAPLPVGSAAAALLAEPPQVPAGYVEVARGESFGLYVLDAP